MVTPEQVDQLNQAITGDYRRLSEEMRTHLGIDYLDWCGFAAWSSHTIGASIGDIGRKDNAFWSLSWSARRMTKVVRRSLRGGDGIGQLVAGNIAIYREMRAVYGAVMSDELAGSIDDQVAQVGAMATPHMRAEQPPTDEEWESVLTGARCYLECGQSDDPRRRRELVLAAAAHFSAFEQARVDAMLDEFMYAPTRRFRMRFLRWVPGKIGSADARTFMEAGSAWFFTRFLTILVAARGPMQLGRRFRLPPAADYPEGENPLEVVREPAATAALRRYGLDPTPDIWDWSSFEQRMKVIVAYFRSYQHIPEMIDFAGLPEPPESPPAMPDESD